MGSVDPIDFADHDSKVGDAGQSQNSQMLRRLRHWPVIGGDHQQHGVDRQHAREHVRQEPFVTRNVDEPHYRAGLQANMREAKIDGHAALFLFRQAIRIDPGQRTDQSCLAVVDMPRQSNDHGQRDPGFSTISRSSPRLDDVRRAPTSYRSVSDLDHGVHRERAFAFRHREHRD